MAQVTIGDYAAATLKAAHKPVTQDNIDKLVAWWHWESGGGNAASFNPADIIMGALGSSKPDPSGTTPFNTFASGGRVYHVANYPSLAWGLTMTTAFILAHPTLSSAFDPGVSYADGLTRINQFQASFASPSFMQNIQNTSQSQAEGWKSTPINHGMDIPGGDTILGDAGAANSIETPVTSASTSAIDAASNVFGAFSSVTDFLNSLWKGLTSKETWLRVGMFIGGFILVLMGLWLFAARSQEIPGPAQTATLAAKA